MLFVDERGLGGAGLDPRSEEVRMAQHILVAYATRAGSTREIAEAIAQVLRENGSDVDVRPVKDVSDLAGYDSLVLGSAIRVGKLLPETMQFAQRYQAVLSGLPMAFFVVCGTLKVDTAENRQTVLSYLVPLRQIKEPVTLGLFAGAMSFGTIHPLLRPLFSWCMSRVGVTEGDWRDWPRIRAWAAGLTAQLAARQPALAVGG
jgi:menaquinone-dependent protoporphyrinogen oxidase